MGKKIWNMLLFLIVVCMCGGLTVYLGQGFNSMVVYNLVFMGIMIVIYLLGMIGGMWRMNDLGQDLKTAGLKLEDYFENPGEKSEKLSERLLGLFSDEYLDKKMKNFLLGMRRSKEGIVDLEEYLNEDEMDNYVHKRMLEMIPDILTSLGILGTFVGLVWGLKSFEPSSYESMTSSVSMLVEGIKVAFLTSIYGVSMSIVYTYGVKSEYSTMIDELQGFLAKFHGFVMPTAENKSRNMLVATQKQQNEVLSQMAVNLSEQMAANLEAVITPAFVKMNQTLRDLSTTVTSRQQEALKEIVDAFVVEMHHSFRNEFQNEHAVLEEMTRQQAENVTLLEQTYQKVIQDMQLVSETTVQSTKTLLEAMDENQKIHLETMGRIIKESQETQKMQGYDYQHMTDFLQKSEKTASEFWTSSNQKMQQYLESAAKSAEQFQYVGDQSSQVLEANQKAIDTFREKLSEMTDYQQLNYQVMVEMCKLLNGISVVGNEKEMYLVGDKMSGALADQEKMQRTLRSMQELMEEQTETQKEFLNEMRNAIKKSEKKGRFGLFR